MTRLLFMGEGVPIPADRFHVDMLDRYASPWWTTFRAVSDRRNVRTVLFTVNAGLVYGCLRELPPYHNTVMMEPEHAATLAALGQQTHRLRGVLAGVDSVFVAGGAVYSDALQPWCIRLGFPAHRIKVPDRTLRRDAQLAELHRFMIGQP